MIIYLTVAELTKLAEEDNTEKYRFVKNCKEDSTDYGHYYQTVFKDKDNNFFGFSWYEGDGEDYFNPSNYVLNLDDDEHKIEIAQVWPKQVTIYR
ncbi:hypothetical protein MUDAN_BIHEEGNE_03137 [Lactiplantibacillus mudanjiangensis]|uniref:hypothetical protein n=1 Tax=Lactiplantibacillus mudanjiangensis TaxID=1296538 RepID=UPI001014FAC8|nr:hypothetical protein MUDAN_BIHEEGNE_03137 [Lactiplantibacillus mudanjiangensis]